MFKYNEDAILIKELYIFFTSKLFINIRGNSTNILVVTINIFSNYIFFNDFSPLNYII